MLWCTGTTGLNLEKQGKQIAKKMPRPTPPLLGLRLTASRPGSTLGSLIDFRNLLSNRLGFLPTFIAFLTTPKSPDSLCTSPSTALFEALPRWRGACGMHITLVLTAKPQGGVANHRTTMNAQGCALVVGSLLEAPGISPLARLQLPLPQTYVDPGLKVGGVYLSAQWKLWYLLDP